MTRTINVTLSDEAHSLLEKRAKKELLELDELIANILRRSMLSYKKSSTIQDKTDDSLVSIFSRRKAGRKSKI